MPMPIAAKLMLLLPSLALALNPDGSPKIHTVFCAECSNNFDYKSIGVYWSHNVSGMPGGVTRLLACSKEQLARYKGLHLGPTFVHENHGRIPYSQTPNELGLPAGAKLPHGARSSDSSPSYNKPGSIMHWVNEAEEARDVDYVLYIDADMLLRKPMDPVALGVRPGVVVSEHVGYLDTGLRNGLASEFLPDAEGVEYARGDLDRGPRRAGDVSGRKHSAGGWYHFFHMSDIRKIAHRWLHYCRMMRLNPQKYWRMIGPDGAPGGVDHDIVTGDSFVSHGQAPWISEMFGYVFAAAEARLTHVLTDGIVVYPDDIGAGRATEPYIIHYGLHCKVGAFAFTKYSHGGFDAVGCTGKVFGDPPQPKHLERLCAETVLTLNDAMCDYYAKPHDHGGCAHPMPDACPAWKRPLAQGACEDTQDRCPEWAKMGECEKNPGFMSGGCPRSCGGCDKPSATLEIPAWARGVALSEGHAPPQLRAWDGRTARNWVEFSPGLGVDAAQEDDTRWMDGVAPAASVMAATPARSRLNVSALKAFKAAEDGAAADAKADAPPKKRKLRKPSTTATPATTAAAAAAARDEALEGAKAELLQVQKALAEQRQQMRALEAEAATRSPAAARPAAAQPAAVQPVAGLAAAARPPKELSSLTQRMALMWGLMMSACVAMVAMRMGLCRGKRKPRVGAARADGLRSV